MAISKEQLIIELKAAGVKLTTAQLKKLGKETDKATSGFKNMAIAMTAFYGAQKAMSAVINTGMEFTSAMSNLKAITGATGKDLKALESSAKELGKTTKFTAGEVVSLQTEFGKLGYSSKQIQDAQASTLALAAAVNTDLSTAAVVAGQTVNQFRLTAEDTGRVVDVMTMSFTKSALDLEKFTNAMTYVGPLAGEMGVEIEGVTALMSKLADVGIDGSIAGTALRRVFLEMGNEASKLSKKVGFAVKSEEDLFKALKILEAQGLSTAEMEDLVGKRAVTAFAAMIDMADGAEELAGALDKAAGTAENMANEQLNNLAGDLYELRSAAEAVYLEIYETLEPVFRALAQAATEFLRGIDPEEVKAYASAIFIVVGAWTAYTYGARAATFATKNFKKALVASGIGIAIAAIGSLIDWLGIFEETEQDVSMATIDATEREEELEKQRRMQKLVTSDLIELEAELAGVRKDLPDMNLAQVRNEISKVEKQIQDITDEGLAPKMFGGTWEQFKGGIKYGNMMEILGFPTSDELKGIFEGGRTNMSDALDREFSKLYALLADYGSRYDDLNTEQRVEFSNTQKRFKEIVINSIEDNIADLQAGADKIDTAQLGVLKSFRKKLKYSDSGDLDISEMKVFDVDADGDVILALMKEYEEKLDERIQKAIDTRGKDHHKTKRLESKREANLLDFQEDLDQVLLILGLGEQDMNIKAESIQNLLIEKIQKPMEEITFGDVLTAQTDIMTGVLTDAKGENEQFFDWFISKSQKANKVSDDMITELITHLKLLREQESELDTLGNALEKYEALLLAAKQTSAEDTEKLAEKITVQAAVEAGLTELSKETVFSAKKWLEAGYSAEYVKIKMNELLGVTTDYTMAVEELKVKQDAKLKTDIEQSLISLKANDLLKQQTEITKEQIDAIADLMDKGFSEENAIRLTLMVNDDTTVFKNQINAVYDEIQNEVMTLSGQVETALKDQNIKQIESHWFWLETRKMSEEQYALEAHDKEVELLTKSNEFKALKEEQRTAITAHYTEKRKKLAHAEAVASSKYAAQGVKAVASALAALGEVSGMHAKDALNLKIIGAIADTYAGAQQALAAYPPPWSFAMAGAVVLQGVANVKQMKKQYDEAQAVSPTSDQPNINQPTIALATGGTFITDGPQNILVGDNPGGSELVSVRPIGSREGGGMGGGVTINISGNVMTEDFVEGELREKINDMIRRGNLG